MRLVLNMLFVRAKTGKEVSWLINIELSFKIILKNSSSNNTKKDAENIFIKFQKPSLTL